MQYEFYDSNICRKESQEFSTQKMAKTDTSLTCQNQTGRKEKQPSQFKCKITVFFGGGGNCEWKSTEVLFIHVFHREICCAFDWILRNTQDMGSCCCCFIWRCIAVLSFLSIFKFFFVRIDCWLVLRCAYRVTHDICPFAVLNFLGMFFRFGYSIFILYI